LMTEPPVASSDATNIETSVRRDGDGYSMNGRKWWWSGGGDSRCRIAIVMGKSDFQAEQYAQQLMMLMPLDAECVKIAWFLSVFGYDGAPHGHMEITLDNVRVPAAKSLLGEGRRFEIAQGHLGPGQVHHCMRTIGTAEEALSRMSRRLVSQVAFGKRIADPSVWEKRVARARIDIEMTRLLWLKSADMMDRAGDKVARNEIVMLKVQTPQMALKVIDDAAQAHGGGGTGDDFSLARSWAGIRKLRLADGPDEIHNRAIARAEYGKSTHPPAAQQGGPRL
jgi:acyl-CoA dehydrogenase